MALIYANAVNKRMSQTPCRKISADCQMRSSSSRNSREGTPRKKLSCAAAIHGPSDNAFGSEENSHAKSQAGSRRSLKISRLSSAEIVSKAEEDLKRKHSTPAMSQSMIAPSSCGNCRKKEDIGKSTKAGLQKYNMHSSMIARLDSDSSSDGDVAGGKKKENRPTVRRVQTAREARQRSDSEGSIEQFKKRKSSVLERMRRKLSSLKI